MPLYAGLDWAKEEHAVCVVDDGGAVKLKLSVIHTAEGLSQMLNALRRLPEPPRIAIERPSGLLVVPIHPNVVKATRPRYRAAGGKSDPGDAYLLADLLRTDGHRFKPVAALSDESRALRALVRTRDDLVAERVALANQLRSLLESFWPGAGVLFAEVDSPIALAFLSQYPTPHSAARLGPKRLAAFLARNSYCGRRSVEELLARLRSAPSLTLGEAETEAKGGLVRALVAILSILVQQRLRRALTCWADNSRHASASAQCLYSAATPRGCDHPHAVRILSRSWVRVLWHCLADAQPYQVEKHRAAAKLAA